MAEADDLVPVPSCPSFAQRRLHRGGEYLAGGDEDGTVSVISQNGQAGFFPDAIRMFWGDQLWVDHHIKKNCKDPI